MLQPNQEILFTRQLHEAEKAGRHYDIRFVVGDKAYSFATKKELPTSGQAILLYEQPVHTSHYALSKRVEIPSGQYGAGVTTLVDAFKAKTGEHGTSEQLTINAKGNRYLLKKLEEGKYGKKAWLFKNLGKEETRYLEKASMLISQYAHPETGHTKWVAENKQPPEGYIKTDKALYVRKGLSKKAEDLRPHQESALNKLDREGGVLVHHSTGSGKTKTFLTAVKRDQENNPDSRQLIVAPASLVSNVDKELIKHKLKVDRGNLDVVSYEKAVRDFDELNNKKYSLVVFDEAHKLRNSGTQRGSKLADLALKADKKLLATATANYNQISDISPLVNIAAGGKVLPTEKKEMENRYVKTIKENPGVLMRILGAKPTETQTLTNTGPLKEVLKKYVDYYDSKEDPGSAEKFPSVHEKIIETQMDPEQERLYKYVEGDLPLLLRIKIRNGLPLDKKEKASLNQFSTGVRQVSNSTSHLTGSARFTNKINTAVNNLKSAKETDPDFKGVVYSNFIDAGLNQYSNKLSEEDIGHTVFTGALSKAQKDAAVKDYNSGKTPVLLISSSGAEGLDLKGTKLIQVIEPHFNKSKIKQVIGRGARYESHEHLNPEDRHVYVEHYVSTLTPSKLTGKTPMSIDKYLSQNSDDKDELFNQIRNLMK